MTPKKPRVPMEKVRNYDWQQEFDNLWDELSGIEGEESAWQVKNIEKIKQFTESLLIKILAQCESAEDARACRHIIKEYILKNK